MKKIILIFALFAIVLSSCEPKKETSTEKKYTVQVNYYSSMGEIPYSDTLIFVSEEEPYLRIYDGVTGLYGSSYSHPIATHVRSFKIISIE